MMENEIDLDNLQRLSDAATPAPWTADVDVRGDCVLFGPNGRFVANSQAAPHWAPYPGEKRAVVFDVDRRDLLFIEAARTAVPELIETIQHKDEEIESLKSKIFELEYDQRKRQKEES